MNSQSFQIDLRNKSFSDIEFIKMFQQSDKNTLRLFSPSLYENTGNSIEDTSQKYPEYNSFVPFTFGKHCFAASTEHFEYAAEFRHVCPFFSYENSHILGLFIHDNQYIPCFDISSLFSLNLNLDSEPDSNNLAVIFSYNGKYISFPADEVLPTIEIPFNDKAKQIFPQSDDYDFISLNELGGKNISILDIKKIIELV